MRFNRLLSVIAVIYLVINLVFYLNATTLNGGESMIYLFIFPCFWIITLIIIIILFIKRRKTWFKKDMLLSTLIALFFCTPVSILLFAFIFRPASYMVSSGSNQVNGHEIKYEEWIYNNGNKSVTKYWSDNEKDSTWVYFDKNGDTLATETYRNDSLIHKKAYK